MIKSLVSFEEKVFANVPGYKSMGSWIYYLSAITGSILGLASVYTGVSGDDSTVAPMLLSFSGMTMSLCAIAIADSMLRIADGTTALKKSLFNCLLIIVAMVAGCVASIVVLIAVAVLLAFFLLSGAGKGALSSGRKSSPDSVTGADGNQYWVSSENSDGSITTTTGERMRKMPDGNYQEF